MTEQQIIETLATKVMGWEKHEVELELSDGGTQKFFDSWKMNGIEVATRWRPLYNIADAWMIVDRFKQEPDAYIRMTFESHVPPLICAIDPGAICEAAKKTIEAIESRV